MVICITAVGGNQYSQSHDTAYEMASKVAAQGIAMLLADYWRSQHKLAFHLFLGTHRTPPHLKT